MDPGFLLGLFLIGLVAGTIGTIFGVGGGVMVVPALTILYSLTAQEAAAISLVGIAASSSYAASYFISEEVVNIRLGMILLVPTVMGSLIGASLALNVQEWILLCLLAAVMTYSGLYMIRNPERLSSPPRDSRVKMTYRNRTEIGGVYREYTVNHPHSSLAVGGISGALSSLTGIGGGSINVPLMNIWMGVPMKVSTSTSSFIISITSMSGALIYYLNGVLLPIVAASVTLGMLAGSYLGSHSTRYINGYALRRHFSVFMFVMAVVAVLKAGGYL